MVPVTCEVQLYGLDPGALCFTPNFLRQVLAWFYLSSKDITSYRYYNKWYLLKVFLFLNQIFPFMV